MQKDVAPAGSSGIVPTSARADQPRTTNYTKPMTKEEFKKTKASVLTQIKASLKETPTRTELQQAGANWALWLE